MYPTINNKIVKIAIFTFFSYSIYPLLKKIYNITINLFLGDGNIRGSVSNDSLCYFASNSYGDDFT